MKIDDKKILDIFKKYNSFYTFTKINKIENFSLSFEMLRNYTYNNILAFGDLIHRIHPLAGQGFNMTIRDIKIMSKIVNGRISLGLPIDISVAEDFQNSTKHLNYLYGKAIDGIYEFFRLDSSKHNLALLSSKTIPTKITLRNETADRCFTDDGTIKEDLKSFLSDQQWQIIEGNEAIAEFVILVLGGQLSGSDCLLAIKVSYERGFLLPVIGLEDETYRSDTFTNVILSSVIGLVAQKKKVADKYTLEKIKMLIKDILSDISEAKLYHEENVAHPYIATK